MNTDPESAQQALLKSWRALEQGDRQAARRWAEMAVAQKPDLEEPWLIMAAIGSPRASVAYLNQALQVNPQSERARKGMQWAVERLRKEKGRGRDAGNPSDKLKGDRVFQHGASPEPVIRSRVEIPPQAIILHSANGSSPTIDKSLAKYRWSFLSFLVMAVCVTAIWACWPKNASPVLAFLHVPLSTPLVFGAPNEVDKPTYTSTFTPTFTPTCSSTPTPTITYTPTPTETYTPTETLTPTETYTPSLTPLPTDAPKPKPTDTPFPFPDYGGVRWIDVDLSQQMLYAYEGSTIVARFLISSGVPAFPTVTGQFHIYIKLISTLMAGDGYYLPNVPFTMYFYKGYGIHGTYWHHNFGHPMSHGCVNMYTPDAEWMFNWASEGTLVNIHY
jgi:lipoprotein-anchoring transpeptidase ErfK/SrfK